MGTNQTSQSEASSDDTVSSVIVGPRSDMDGDGKITDADVRLVLDDAGTPDNPLDDTESSEPATGARLVRLASGGVAVDINGLAAEGDSALDMFVLKTRTAASAAAVNWTPATTAGTRYLGVAQETVNDKEVLYLIERSGTGATPTYRSLPFAMDMTEDGGFAGTATMVGTVGQKTLSTAALLKLEAGQGLDFTGDGVVGDVVDTILATPAMDTDGDGKITDDDTMPFYDDGGTPADQSDDSEIDIPAKGPQLVKLSTGGVAIDFQGIAAKGDSAKDMPLLQTKSAASAAAVNWVPGTAAGTMYLGVIETFVDDKQVLQVIEKSGTTATPVYRSLSFVSDFDLEGYSLGTATMVGTAGQRTLSLSSLLQLEVQSGLDLNNDGITGDAISAVIGGPRMDADGDGKITDDDTFTIYNDGGTPEDVTDDTEVDVLAKGAQLVRLASGGVAVDYYGMAVQGDSAMDMPLLQTRTAASAAALNWAPGTAAGTTYLGVIEQYVNDKEVLLVIEKSGTTATPTYRGLSFVVDLDKEGVPTGTATMVGTTGQRTLSLSTLLQLEAQNGIDLNGDATVGDTIASVFASARMDTNGDGKISDADIFRFYDDGGTPEDLTDDSEFEVPARGSQLLRLASGSIAYDYDGLAAEGDSAMDMPLLQTRTAASAAALNWAPATTAGTTYTGVVPQFVDDKEMFLVIEKSGTTATPTYRSLTFVLDLDNEGNPTGTATMTGTTGQRTLSTSALLQLESRNGLDLNGDNIVGDSVASILAGPRQDVDGNGKITDADTMSVYDDGGTPEDESDDSETDVPAKGPQLVRLVSGGIAVDYDGVAVQGDSAREMPLLQTKTAASAAALNWTTGTVAGTSYFGVIPQIVNDKEVLLVIEKSGTTAMPNYRSLSFVVDLDGEGVPTGTATMVGTAGQRTLSASSLLQLESQNDLDLNGDGTIGDAVATILASPREDVDGNGKITDADTVLVDDDGGTPDDASDDGEVEVLARGPQLVRLVSGAVAVDYEGLAVRGDSAQDMPLLQTKAAATGPALNWAPGTVAGTSYFGVIEQVVNGKDVLLVIEKSGTTATPAYRSLSFVVDVDANNNPTGTATMVGTTGQRTLSLSSLLQLETQTGLDLNGDTGIGDAVATVLASPRRDTDDDGRITASDVVSVPTGDNGTPDNPDDDPTTDVLARGPQLVRLVSGGVAVDVEGLAARGDSAIGMPLLQTRPAATGPALNWAPGTVAGTSYLGVIEQVVNDKDVLLVIEKSGTTATPAYRSLSFVVDVDANNNPTGTATMVGTTGQRTLSLSSLLQLETQTGLDLNADTGIGDAVATVLANPRKDANKDGVISAADVMEVTTGDNGTPNNPDDDPTADVLARGLQLLRTSSGGVVLDYTGAAVVGNSATGMPLLQIKAAATGPATNWLPSTVAGTRYLGVIESDDGERVTVVERTGTAATSALRLWQFSPDYENNGSSKGTLTAIGTAAPTVAATTLISLESSSGLDLDGDGRVPVPALLQGSNGSDVLVGTGGNDTLIGSGGRDTLEGGLGADRFVFSDIADGSLVATGVTDVIRDLSVNEDLLEFADDGPIGIKVRGSYSSVVSFSKAADKLLDGKVKLVFGIVGNDGYIAFDSDGTGVTHLIQLVGVRQLPSIVVPDDA